MHKNTIIQWETRFADQKKPLMLYALCHEFIQLTFEGDEVYTVVGRRTDPADAEGWKAVILERASRFIVEQRCSRTNTQLFESVMTEVARYVDRTADLTLLSDGERRYGNTLFERCAQILCHGRRGRPPKTLPPNVRVWLKNKGNRKRRPGRPRPMYETHHRERLETARTLAESDIHTHHLEGQNAALRRRNSAFRRRTNTYAKSRDGLQRTLDVRLLFHNFVRSHWTTGVVPAVALGIFTGAGRLEDLLITGVA